MGLNWYYFFKYNLRRFPFLFSFQDSNDVQVVYMNVTLHFTQVLSHFFIPLFLCPLAG